MKAIMVGTTVAMLAAWSFAACGTRPTGGTGGAGGAGGAPEDASAPVDAGPIITEPDAAAAGQAIGEPSDEANYIFDQTELRTYEIIIAPEDLATINADPAAEEYVQAKVLFEGKEYGPVGVRYKGSVGAWLPPCTAVPLPISGNHGPKTGKCSVKIGFDFVDDDARFFGLKKLNFHAMNSDPSLMRERLGYAMFREMGVAASRAVHARLLINGKLEGLFALVEEPDSRFTRSRFTEGGGKGNLYKEVWPKYTDTSKYQDALESNKSDPQTFLKMLSFKAAIEAGPEQAERWMDRDYMARYLAVDRVIVNDDGALHWYCSSSSPGEANSHNFFWYEAKTADRFWLVPWDLDMSFAGNAYVRINPRWNQTAPCLCYPNGFGSSQKPATCDPLVAMWASWKDDYAAKVDEFIAGPFAEEPVQQKLDAWSEQIADAVAEAAGRGGAVSVGGWNLGRAAFSDVIRRTRATRGGI